MLSDSRIGRRRLLVAALIVVAGGCSAAPSRVSAPDWDPDESADQAIADLDKDGDGLLSMEELSAAPGLKYCVEELDTDRDKKLSREEIYARIKLYQDMRGGLASFTCKVTLNGRPLGNATVRLVPEPFLGDVIEPAVGTTTRSGHAQPTAESADVAATRIGMYRVEITSPDVDIPVRYNTQTTLGVEVAAVTDPKGRAVFRLTSP